jgi:hypothetical protein
MIEVAIPPGATRVVPISIQNQDEREARIKLSISGVEIERNGFLTFSEMHEASDDWVEILPESLRLDSRRMSTARVTIRVPREREEDVTLIRAVRLEAESEEIDPGWGSGNELGVVIVAVDPRAPAAMLTVDKPTLIRSSPKKNPSAAVVTVVNTGGRVARVYGEMILERGSGERIITMDIGKNEDQIILPGKERQFRMPLSPLDKGKFFVGLELHLRGEPQSITRSEVTFSSIESTPEGL